jgi:regulator of protease activity HflC (stomatin/prohibitin superfamily)
MEHEIKLNSPGYLAILVQLGIIIYIVLNLYNNWGQLDVVQWVLTGVAVVMFFVLFGCYCVIAPNEALVLQFMGKYKGTMKQNGFVIKNPFWGGKTLSLKIGSYQSTEIKVNDKNGVPIQIAAVATYKIKDTYKAMYAVDDPEVFLANQFESCLRDLAKKHSYNELVSLEAEFTAELEAVLEKIGYEVQSAKITTLNYAPEISAAMLQKQEANAMGEARQIIVDNAVKMAQHARDQIKFPTPGGDAQFVANLILILCSERPVTTTLSVN